jgi:BirA family transcriptional regulator, biotin operon repressor / biotin---[acetyl-CoA-carboxylase] ligase
MIPDPDTLIPAWIEKETPAVAWGHLIVEGFPQIGSTNDEAIERARKGAPSGLLIYAEEQSQGRGRLGRSWHSPRGAGIYFSLLLRPSQPVRAWPLLTHVASVALACAIKQLSESSGSARRLAPEIKWPNDVLLGGKKAAGILLETCSIGRTDPAAVLGVGINVARDSIPPGLQDRVTSLDVEAGVRLPRRSLLVLFLKRFQQGYQLFEAGSHEQILQEWKRWSKMWNGVRVHVTEGGISRPAVTCGLSENGGLRIRTEDGAEETVLAADVSVRRD